MSHGRRLTRKQKRRHGEADGSEEECPGCGRRYFCSGYAKLTAALLRQHPTCSRECHLKMNGNGMGGVL